MITLPDRFEFLSDAWVDQVRRFLERARRRRSPDRLGAQPFTLSVRFADAPPHLGQAERCRLVEPAL